LIVLTAVLWYGGHLVVHDRLKPDRLIAYLLYQLQLAECLFVSCCVYFRIPIFHQLFVIKNLGTVYTGLMQAVGASRKVFELIDRKPSILNDGQVTKKAGLLEGRVEFKNVNFSYPTRPNVKVLKVGALSIEVILVSFVN